MHWLEKLSVEGSGSFSFLRKILEIGTTTLAHPLLLLPAHFHSIVQLPFLQPARITFIHTLVIPTPPFRFSPGLKKINASLCLVRSKQML